MKPKKSKNILSEEKKYFSNCNLLKISTDGRLISINEKYLAIAHKTSGVINIVNSNESRDLSKEDVNNLISINDKSNILDIEFSPFDNDILAYANENNSVIISKITKEDKKINLNNFDIFQKHKNKVNFVNFNPVASNIMSSGTLFGNVCIWDSNKLEEIYKELPKLNNYLTSLLWSPNGKSIGITTKKGFFNIFDIRENKYIIQNKINGFSEEKVFFNWIDNNNIVVLGHNEKKERIMSLFDIRKQAQNERIKEFFNIKIDSGNADAIPLVNPEMKLIYVIGKDSTKIRMFDYLKLKVEKLTHEINVKETNAYSIIYPRKSLNKNMREIDKIIRCSKNNNIFYINIKIPEKNSQFEENLYTENQGGAPLYTCDKWKDIIEGKIQDENIDDNDEDMSQKNIINTKNTKEDNVINNFEKEINIPRRKTL